MGERYWMTGVQLGILEKGDRIMREETAKEIYENQFIGNYPTDRDKKEFKEMIMRTGR